MRKREEVPCSRWCEVTGRGAVPSHMPCQPWLGLQKGSPACRLAAGLRKRPVHHISRILYPPCACQRQAGRTSIIYLGSRSRATSIDLPSGSGGQPFTTFRPPEADRMVPRYTWSFSPWGLPSRTARAARWWALTPPFHPYPLRSGRSPFLWHFPWTCRSRPAPFPLGSTAPYAVRTFLPPAFAGRRWSDAQDVKELTWSGAVVGCSLSGSRVTTTGTSEDRQLFP